MATVKRALITGLTGQDGSYMAELLLSKGYEVHALVRYASTSTVERVEHIKDKLTIHYGDLTDIFSIQWALKKSMPDEIYNFGALSHVQISWQLPWQTAQVTGLGILNILESCRVLGLAPKIYQASTSELYSGRIGEAPQNEQTVKDPLSPYGTAKLYAFQIAKNYRDAHGMFVCNGILFNHESKRRGDNFVTKKIINAIPRGEVRLGNTGASRDWGYAEDYVYAAWLMLQQEKPDDYVIATGETHTIGEFIEWVAEVTGTRLKVIPDPQYNRPHDVQCLCGDASKAEKKLGWKPTVKGKDLVSKML